MKSTYFKTINTLLIAGLLLVATAANAELVTNGDFETGTFAGWTKSGNTTLSEVISNTTTPNHTFLWRSGATGSPAFISQSLATIVGQHYTFGFDLFSSGTSLTNPAAVHFDAWFNGILVYSLSNVTVPTWTHFEFTDLIATSTSTELKFGSRNDPSFTRLDNVSVVGTSNNVPEPATVALLGLGMLGFAAARRRN